MVKITFKSFLFLLLFLNFVAYTQVNPWKAISTQTKHAKTASDSKAYESYDLDVERLETFFNNSSSRVSTEKNTLILPVSDKRFQEFRLNQTSVLHPKLAAKYPTIKTFIGKATDGSGASVRISYASSIGFHGTITNNDSETQHITRATASKTHYRTYKSSDAKHLDLPYECSVTAENLKKKFGSKFSKTELNSNNGFLRKYRLAVATSGEYSQYFLNGTETSDAAKKEKILAAVVATMLRVNGIFERDFGVTMELVAANDRILFLDAASDPFESVSFFDDEFNEQLQTTLDDTAYIGADAYDVGHFFHKTTNEISGNAGCIACVCTNGIKGSGYSQHPNPDMDDFNLLVAHELGHQYGAYHVSSRCYSGNNLSEVEPGSGSTIMSYAGICPPNIQEYADDYFNYVDIREVAEWISSGSDCAELIPISNTVPVANAGLNYNIPKSTPFVLEGIVSETDMNSEWTYCWEQNDPGASISSSSPGPTWQTGPLFRSRVPSFSPKRFMPHLDAILVGNNTPTWEVLPSVTRDLNFALTVRDNIENGGQTASDVMVVLVSDTAGPFTVTSQSTSEQWNVGDQVTVTWDVANTDMAPVNAQTVDIYISEDGGYTYPHLIKSNTVNDGTETFDLPYVPTTSQARLMVRGHNAIFFAVNATNFTVQASEFVLIAKESEKEVCSSDILSFEIDYQTYLDFEEMVTFSVENLPDGVRAELTPSSVSGKHLEGTVVNLQLSGNELLKNREYAINVIGNSASFQKNFSFPFTIYEDTILDFELDTPLDNELLNRRANLKWDEDANVKEYVVEISKDKLFSEILNTYSTEQASFILYQL